MITIELEPENLAVIQVKDNNVHEHGAIQVPVTIGHAIGNLHRPIKLEEARFIFQYKQIQKLTCSKRSLAIFQIIWR